MMTLLELSYNNLKLLAVNKYRRAPIDITPVKEFYKSVINSPRAHSRICDINSLISILEDRCALSPIDIEAFDYIYNKLNLNQNELNQHRELIITSERQWVSLNRYDDNRKPHHRTYNRNQVRSKSTTLLSEEVVNAISCSLGKSWTSLARYLKTTPESRINEILKNPNIIRNEDRARLILNEYQEKAEPSTMKLKLLNALKIVDSKIHDRVQEIFLSEQ